MQTLGPKIQQARRDAGFANAESLAAALGVSPATVERYEQSRGTPSLVRLAEIARLTNRTLTDFLDAGEAAA